MPFLKPCCFILALLAAPAALFSSDWLTFGADPQRSGWARGEETLNAGNVKNLKLEWSVKLDNEAREMNSLTAPVVVNGVITPRGFKELVFVAGSSDTLYAVDADAAKVFWKMKFTVEATPKQQPGWLCPNSLNATPVIDRKNRTVHVITSDGKLHSLNTVNGEDMKPPIDFVPPFSKPWSLNLVDGILYAPISQGCGGAKNAVYAMDLNKPDRPVARFQATTTGGAGIWGRAGVAIGSNGRVYAETGDGSWDPEKGKFADTFLGLTPGNLQLADYYTPSNRAWITKKDLDMGCISPVVFPFKDRELIAGGGKEGVLYLLDSKSMGGADHRTPLYRSPLLTNEDVDFAGRGFWGALSTWEDDEGTRWLYAPAHGPPTSSAPKFPLSHGETPNGSVMAFKVEEKDGRPTLTAAWNSVDMAVPEPVAIANGVVFALANGEFARQVDDNGRLYTSKERVDKKVGNAILYALDSKTGKVLFSSGNTIPSWVHFSGIAVANGRVYLVTYDSTVHAFGLGQQ